MGFQITTETLADIADILTKADNSGLAVREVEYKGKKYFLGDNSGKHYVRGIDDMKFDKPSITLRRDGQRGGTSGF